MSVTETGPQPVAQDAPATTTIAPTSWSSRIEPGLLRRVLIVGVLCVLVMIGLFLTNVSRLHARYYWSAMFPIFGIVSLWHELLGPGRHEGPVWRRIMLQALHWLGPIVAV